MENKFKEVEGDLLKMFKKGTFDAILHGCNCWNNFGAGIAYSIAKQFPSAFDADKTTKFKDINKLGTYSSAKFSEGIIINAYTQFTPGKDLRMNSLKEVLEKVNEDYAGKHIGLPLIGCGLAGGDWNVVKQIVKNALNKCNVTIVHYKN